MIWSARLVHKCHFSKFIIMSASIEKYWRGLLDSHETAHTHNAILLILNTGSHFSWYAAYEPTSHEWHHESTRKLHRATIFRYREHARLARMNENSIENELLLDATLWDREFTYTPVLKCGYSPWPSAPGEPPEQRHRGFLKRLHIFSAGLRDARPRFRRFARWKTISRLFAMMNLMLIKVGVRRRQLDYCRRRRWRENAQFWEMISSRTRKLSKCMESHISA